jgi:hypothetical protein
MSNNHSYKQLKDTYTKENFFVAYALNGPMIDPENGVRAGMPVDTPLKNSPVSEPSPLNTRWQYELPNVSIDGIL